MVLKVTSHYGGGLLSFLSLQEVVSHPIRQLLFPLGWHTSLIYSILVGFPLLQPASWATHTRVLELLLMCVSPSDLQPLLWLRSGVLTVYD